MHLPGHRDACRSGAFSPSGQAAGLPLHQKSPPPLTGPPVKNWKGK